MQGISLAARSAGRELIGSAGALISGEWQGHGIESQGHSREQRGDGDAERSMVCMGTDEHRKDVQRNSAAAISGATEWQRDELTGTGIA